MTLRPCADSPGRRPSNRLAKLPHIAWSDVAALNSDEQDEWDDWEAAPPGGDRPDSFDDWDVACDDEEADPDQRDFWCEPDDNDT